MHWTQGSNVSSPECSETEGESRSHGEEADCVLLDGRLVLGMQTNWGSILSPQGSLHTSTHNISVLSDPSLCQVCQEECQWKQVCTRLQPFSTVEHCLEQGLHSGVGELSFLGSVFTRVVCPLALGAAQDTADPLSLFQQFLHNLPTYHYDWPSVSYHGA